MAYDPICAGRLSRCDEWMWVYFYVLCQQEWSEEAMAYDPILQSSLCKTRVVARLLPSFPKHNINMSVMKKPTAKSPVSEDAPILDIDGVLMIEDKPKHQNMMVRSHNNSGFSPTTSSTSSISFWPHHHKWPLILFWASMTNTLSFNYQYHTLQKGPIVNGHLSSSHLIAKALQKGPNCVWHHQSVLYPMKRPASAENPSGAPKPKPKPSAGTLKPKLQPDVGAPKPKPDMGVLLHPKFVLKLKAKLWADLLALVVCWCSKPNVVVGVAPKPIAVPRTQHYGQTLVVVQSLLFCCWCFQEEKWEISIRCWKGQGYFSKSLMRSWHSSLWVCSEGISRAQGEGCHHTLYQLGDCQNWEAWIGPQSIVFFKHVTKRMHACEEQQGAEQRLEFWRNLY